MRPPIPNKRFLYDHEIVALYSVLKNEIGLILKELQIESGVTKDAKPRVSRIRPQITQILQSVEFKNIQNFTNEVKIHRGKNAEVKLSTARQRVILALNQQKAINATSDAAKKMAENIRNRLPKIFSTARLRGNEYRNSEIAKLLAATREIGINRAKTIARTTISQYNAELTKENATKNGINSYIWSSSDDERVRESHQEVDGQSFTFDDPPEIDGEKVNPGEPINCRCIAELQFE